MQIRTVPIMEPISIKGELKATYGKILLLKKNNAVSLKFNCSFILGISTEGLRFLLSRLLLQTLCRFAIYILILTPSPVSSVQ